MAPLDRRGAGRLRRGAAGTVIYVLLAFGVAAAAYQLLALAAGLRQALRRETRGTFRPPVSILKPLHGLDPDFYQTVRSHALLDYPEFELLFGVSDADDPTIGEIERLRAEFPAVAIRLIRSDAEFLTELGLRIHAIRERGLLLAVDPESEGMTLAAG